MAVSDAVRSSTAASDPEFDALSGHYRLGARLGGGGHGEVHEAWDSKLQRSVAIKRIKHGGTAGADDLVREARMAASLRHAAFVKVHAIEESGGSFFLVMERVEGRTLKQVLADGRPELDAALDWLRQVAEAMRDAHASGLVHGDLKPSNLMIEPDGKLRILDFGLALRQDMLETTTLGQLEPQGTIAYMAPERLLGAQANARGDVYALGVILYEIAAGKRPFADLNGLALAAAQVQSSSDSWQYPDFLEAPLIALIRAMTAHQPERGIHAMDEVLRRLARLPHPGAAPARLEAPPRKPLPRRALWAGAILALALAGALGWRQASAPIARLAEAVTPYAEATDMDAALTALKRYERPGELDGAEARFKRILAHSPDNAAAIAGLSIAYNLRYTSDGRDELWLQKADAGAQLALKLNDQLALSQIADGAVLDRQGKYDAAVGAYERALRLDPQNYLAWYGKIESLGNAGRRTQARAAIDEAIRRFPREAVFVGELGVHYFAQHDYAAAEQAFRRSIAIEPDTVTAYVNLNSILLHQDRKDEALAVLQQGLQVRPSARLYSNLGNVLFARGDYVGAAKAFESAVAPTTGAPGYYLNWANLGDALVWLPGREQQAQHAYDKARRLLAPQLERAPGDAVLASRMGLYAARAGDAAQARQLAQRALGLAPDDASVHFRAGLAYELLGARAAALDAINAAKRLGYPASFIDAEPALIGLRRDPGYHAD